MSMSLEDMVSMMSKTDEAPSASCCSKASMQMQSNKQSSNEDLMQSAPFHHAIAMAYVPIQPWGQVYSPEDGWNNGTIFPDLNKPFCGCRKGDKV